MSETIDCRSPEGVTIGLIDALISVARVLKGRDFTSPEVQEALKDLAQDEDLLSILYAANFYSSKAEIDTWLEDQ
jgi:hypothetical protein